MIQTEQATKRFRRFACGRSCQYKNRKRLGVWADWLQWRRKNDIFTYAGRHFAAGRGNRLMNRMSMRMKRSSSRFFYISDEQFFFANSTPHEMKNYYKALYPNFDEARYQRLLDGFGLDGNRKIRTFSKGMKKQVSVICGVSANTDYLFCDETFDGLDPVARQTVKGLFAGDVAERGLTPVIASHNLRELEDICDHVGLLHRGGILFSKDLEDMKIGMHKVQMILREAPAYDPFEGMEGAQARAERVSPYHHGARHPGRNWKPALQRFSQPSMRRFR